MQTQWFAFHLRFKALLAFALLSSSILPACAQNGDVGAMYIPKPPYAAPGSGYAPSQSQPAQNNQTLDRFNRTQDTYVIAIAVSCAFAGLVLLAVGGIAATIEMRKYELRAAQAGQAGGQRPAESGQRVGDSATSPSQQEHVISVMVVQPDDTVTIACKLAASPKQPQAQVDPQ